MSASLPVDALLSQSTKLTSRALEPFAVGVRAKKSAQMSRFSWGVTGFSQDSHRSHQCHIQHLSAWLICSPLDCSRQHFALLARVSQVNDYRASIDGHAMQSANGGLGEALCINPIGVELPLTLGAVMQRELSADDPVQ